MTTYFKIEQVLNGNIEEKIQVLRKLQANYELPKKKENQELPRKKENH